MTVLPEPAWQALQHAHETRVRAWTDPHHARTAHGEKHPVYDFLFTYYGFRPAWLRRWHPGPDVILAGTAAREFLRWPEYQETPDGVALNAAAAPVHRREYLDWLRRLLTAMQERPAFFGCHGLHEWAMVYRQTPDEVRHNAWPLRFPAAELAQIVEANAVCCSHYDAFRFFTPPARPLNKLQPTRVDVPQLEQRGCLHANMDLYKWAFKLAPFAPSQLIADGFELARDIRAVDMRASPYDLRSLGFVPIPIETTAGREEYERHQRAFTARGEPLRAQLIALCDRLLAGGS
ncbi:3-methyladenine DNA glycosylase [Horticoccus sp. 23ND18S-11]|uniref:3-methyladenine DNA glycosylase n=1 Tax=Horticoccus sp. 23ND18S-11 TaxID=3391832 RepID=UPI0039C99E7C